MRDDDWQDINYCRAQYIPHDQQKKAASKFLYIPSSANSKLESTCCKVCSDHLSPPVGHFLQVPLKRKLGEHVEAPRVLENEGYYVGRKPYMTKRNKNLMEHRILKANNNVSLLTAFDR